MSAVLLLDSWSREAAMLHRSLISAGFQGQTLVLEDDGYLPEGVVSVRRWFCGDMHKHPGFLGRPRFFNEIPMPDYWEVSGTMQNAKVTDLTHERARIFYSSERHKRHVKSVEWLDENNRVSCVEHYDSSGVCYARSTCDANGRQFCRTWFDAEGKEVLMENFPTGDFILNRDGKTFIFRGLVDFTLYLLQSIGMPDMLLYNSLGVPFFVSNRLPRTEKKKDVLFWQERPRPDVPGNMQFILEGSAARTCTICVQNRQSYEKLRSAGAVSEMLRPLGQIYSFRRQNSHGSNALICTNSDQIEQLARLVSQLPQLHFHITALTEMSPKLMAMEKYNNVTLYPAAGVSRIEKLFDICDYYLDINHQDEIVDAVQKAFESHLLILAFRNTVHNRELTAKNHIFSNASDMADLLQQLLDSDVLLEDHLADQDSMAMRAEPEEYNILLDR